MLLPHEEIILAKAIAEFDTGAKRLRFERDLLALVERIAKGETGTTHGVVCEADPCFRCEARDLVARAEALR